MISVLTVRFIVFDILCVCPAYLAAHVETFTSDETYLWGQTFDEDLNIGASISSADGANVEFVVDDFLYKIRMISDYFSVTLVDGDVTSLGGICGGW